jgi:hypothetical protein
MGGAIPPLPQYAFMACCSVKEKSTGTTLPLPFIPYLRALGNTGSIKGREMSDCQLFKDSICMELLSYIPYFT